LQRPSFDNYLRKFQPDESAIDFANRVKKAIAIRGGLVDLEWDGQLKRSKVPAKMVDQQRER
jgi:glycerol-3-phosphate O-acyltransferase 3/4